MQSFLCSHFQELYKNGFTFLNDDNSNNHTIDTEDTSHNNGDNRLHDKLGFEDTHGTDANSSFGTTVGGSEVGEDES